MKAPLLMDVSGLRVAFEGPHGYCDAVRGVDFQVEAGDVLGIVGESGSGKSVTMMAMLQLLPPNARVTGSAKFMGRELIGMPTKEVRHILGREIGCIFQDPLSAFNPVMTIGDQIAEAITLHNRSISKRAALQEAEHLLALVSISQPKYRLQQYPYEFSGGMRQRAMIAMALANKPKLLIADEPTTALDVTVQAQILELLQRLGLEMGIGLILITHDLGVVAGMADHINVMYGGRVVEKGTVDAVFYETKHPYTRGLMNAVPALDRSKESLVSIPGTPPSLWAQPTGCSFHPRCRYATDICQIEDPVLRQMGNIQGACHHAEALSNTVELEGVQDA